MDAYAREDLLGRGAMGSVFMIRRFTDGERFAMKTVAIASPKDREVALNEIAILRSLEQYHLLHERTRHQGPARHVFAVSVS